MQLYRIVHQTYYSFTAEVSLEQHKLMLRPREDHAQRIQSGLLDISPQAKLMWHQDAEGNSVAIATFDQPTSRLSIESEVIVEQYNENPLDFLVEDYAVHFPCNYLEQDRSLLAPYRQLPLERERMALLKWVSEFWDSSQSIQNYSLLLRIARHIHDRLQYQVREEPGVQPALETLQRGSGSCRDFAFLFMQAARCLGMATRFVSGYLYVPGMTTPASTHAWAEAYLPGAGWLGFDPTIGDIVGGDHFPVAVACLPESVPPVSGSYLGAAEASLQVGVWVTPCAQ